MEHSWNFVKEKYVLLFRFFNTWAVLWQTATSIPKAYYIQKAHKGAHFFRWSVYFRKKQYRLHKQQSDQNIFLLQMSSVASKILPIFTECQKKIAMELISIFGKIIYWKDLETFPIRIRISSYQQSHLKLDM